MSQGPALDLTRKAWSRDVPLGLTFIGTWLRQGDTVRPCMVIIRTGEELNEHTIPCVVTLDKAWIWSEEIGDGFQSALTVCKFAEALRLDTSSVRELDKLGGMIADHLGDLLNMSISPPGDSVVVADMRVKDWSTGITREVEVREDV